MPFDLPPHVVYALRRASWFPGHMHKTLKDFKAKHLPQANLVLEVRDARVPLSSINGRLTQLIREANKERIIVYNKCDLIRPLEKNALEKAFRQWRPADKVLFTACEGKSGDGDIKRIIKMMVTKASDDSRRFASLKVLVVGMPNVGKSTILNALRRVGVHKGKAAATGALPGITRRVVGTVKIVEEPPVYIIDSPGVMVPYVSDAETLLKLAMTAGTKQHGVDMHIVIDYLLYHLNQNGAHEKYLQYSTLSQPAQNAQEFLPTVAQRIGALLPGGIPDIANATEFLLRKYREGKFGEFCLDDTTPEFMDNFFQNNHDLGIGAESPTNVEDMSSNQVRKMLWNQKMDASEERRKRKRELSAWRL